MRSGIDWQGIGLMVNFFPFCWGFAAYKTNYSAEVHVGPISVMVTW